MGKIAFLYAGQGSQYAGMGKDLYDKFPEFRNVMDAVKLDFDLKEICFENPNGMLDKTEYTQPCMVAFACGVNQILKTRKIMPDYVCGLSLGEYSALNMAGVWDARDTIKTVAFRGKVMAQASQEIESGMTAIIGLSEDKARECCEAASDLGIVSICNLNCPGQVVIGGEKVAVEKAAEIAKSIGAKRCVPLNVSGPFHTSIMKPAGDLLGEYFKTITFQKPQTEVLYNYLGGPAAGQTISELLIQQIQKPVRMEDIIRYLFLVDVRMFVEVGPGTVLEGFVKKVGKAMGIETDDYQVMSVENVKGIETLISMISEENIIGRI